MTFEEFREDFINWLKDSNVNLGRKQAKTRNQFLEEAAKRFDFYGGFDEGSFHDLNNEVNNSQESTGNPTNDRVLCNKPTNCPGGLNAGKGVCTMTSSESMRADEELGRSPFVNQTDKKE